MNARNLATDKIQITQVPMVLPACCIVCGATNRPVVDWAFSIDYYGAVLFCVDCMADAASKVGYAPVASIEAERKKYLETMKHLSEVTDLLKDRVKLLNDLVGGLPDDIERILSGEPVSSTEESEINVGEPDKESGSSEWSVPGSEGTPGSVFKLD